MWILERLLFGLLSFPFFSSSTMYDSHWYKVQTRECATLSTRAAEMGNTTPKKVVRPNSLLGMKPQHRKHKTLPKKKTTTTPTHNHETNQPKEGKGVSLSFLFVVDVVVDVVVVVA